MSAGATAQPVPARLAGVRLISIIARPVRGCRPRLLCVLQSTCSSTDIHRPLRRVRRRPPSTSFATSHGHRAGAGRPRSVSQRTMTAAAQRRLDQRHGRVRYAASVAMLCLDPKELAGPAPEGDGLGAVRRASPAGAAEFRLHAQAQAAATDRPVSARPAGCAPLSLSSSAATTSARAATTLTSYR
jgi:hypothetical protein